MLGPIRQQINETGIPIEQSDPEYAPGQVEVNIRYADALTSADRVVVFRSLVKQLARRHGYLATFMSKPFFGQSGNGFHVHHSLSKEGTNVFSAGGKLSASGLNYLAGLQTRMAETALCSATTPNAYRRRQPYTFCPINTTWGIDNRTVGLRVIEGADDAVRVEQHDGSADCNPYLLLAAQIAAGLDGVEQNMQPTAMTRANGYEAAEDEPLPTDIGTALELARGSEFLKRVLDEDLYALLIQQGERELDFVGRQVTPVEIERYLENF